MRELGVVHFVQIQRSPLKTPVDGGANRTYDPAPLLRVARLRLTPLGVLGITEAGETLLDVHHSEHPQTRNRGHQNGVSFGFTGHYDAIRERYGAHHADGISGENIIIAGDAAFLPDDGAGRLVIQRGATPLLRLREVFAAAPCEPFSRYIAGGRLPGAAMKATLRFLADGRRGYYATLDETVTDAPEIQAGDRVYWLDDAAS